MKKIAVDIVLIPPPQIQKAAIALSRRITRGTEGGIRLNRRNRIPHISLVMGPVRAADLPGLKKLLRKISERRYAFSLRVDGVYSKETSFGRKVTGLKIEKTQALLALHTRLVRALKPFFSYPSRKAHFVSSQKVDRLTLLWLDHYLARSSGRRYFPHITIALGGTKERFPRSSFRASRLALCRLGPHCTCASVLASFPLS